MSTEGRFKQTQVEGIVQNQESGVYYLRDTVHGIDPTTGQLKSERVDRSLKTTAFGEAKDRAKALRAKIAAGETAARARETVERRDFDAAFDLVLKIKAGQDQDTESQAAAIINGHLRPWFSKKYPRLARFEKEFESIWAEYQVEGAGRKPPKYLKTEEERQRFLEENPTPRKLEHDRRYLVMALKRAFRAGWIRREFKKEDFPLNEVSEPIGKYIEDQDVQKLLDASRKHGRLHLQVAMAVLMGMRISEVLHLRKEEIDFKRKEIDLNPKRVKTRKRREVPIPIAADILPELKAAYEAAPGPYIFPAWNTNKPGRPIDPDKPQDDNSYFWDKVREETGVDARFHDLRHSAITNLLKAGVPDFAVRKICGVSEQTMRRIYAHIEKEMKERFRNVFAGRFQ